MRNHENIISILRERRERNASRPPPYTAEDPTIPEDVRRIAEEDFERLLPILGVFKVFEEPPTIKQITRVLGLAEDEVREVWGPISAYLDGPDSDEKKRRLKSLERLVCLANGTPSIDSPTYHNLVARWCLLGPKGGARYVANFLPIRVEFQFTHHFSKGCLLCRQLLGVSCLPVESIRAAPRCPRGVGHPPRC